LAIAETPKLNHENGSSAASRMARSSSGALRASLSRSTRLVAVEREILVDDVAVAQARRGREETRQKVGHRRRARLVVDDVDDAQVHGGQIGRHRAQRAQQRDRLRHDFFVGVEDERPAARRQRERLVARPAEVVAPFTMDHVRAVRERDLDRAIRRARVDDVDLVDAVAYARQALGEETLLVLDDHAQTDAFGELFALRGGNRQVEQQTGLALCERALAVLVDDL
jgi:hypothetical protein